MRSLNEQKYNKVKELLEKGFHASMSDFNPTKQSFYRGHSNRNTRRNFKNGGSASNGFEIEGTPSKFKSSASISQFQGSSPKKGSPTSYAKRNTIRSNRDYGASSSKNGGNHTISHISQIETNPIRKVLPDNLNKDSYTDNEDSKTMKSTPNRFSKQRKISKRNIK